MNKSSQLLWAIRFSGIAATLIFHQFQMFFSLFAAVCTETHCSILTAWAIRSCTWWWALGAGLDEHWVTRPKNFIETDTETSFRDQNFRDRDRDFFSRPKMFETNTETFFETKCFRDRYRDFSSGPNVFETDTETVLRPNFFATDTETFAKVKK